MKPSAVRVQTHSLRGWSKHSSSWGREGQEKGSPFAAVIGRVEHHAVCSSGQLRAAAGRDGAAGGFSPLSRRSSHSCTAERGVCPRDAAAAVGGQAQRLFEGSEGWLLQRSSVTF